MCRGCNYEQSEKKTTMTPLAKKWQKNGVLYTYQNTYNGLSVALFNLHSKRNVDPSLICKSGASIISATASVWRREEKREKNNVKILLYHHFQHYFINILSTSMTKRRTTQKKASNK